MKAEDVPPLSSSTWWSWRWWWHLVHGGRVGTYCSSSRCRGCSSMRELEAGRGWPPLPRPLPAPPPAPVQELHVRFTADELAFKYRALGCGCLERNGVWASCGTSSCRRAGNA